MFKSIEATGKTLDLAIQAGLTKLQMDRDSVCRSIGAAPFRILRNWCGSCKGKAHL